MGTLDTVHAGRTPRRLPFAVRHLDDSSPTVRFTNMANSRLREIRVHFTGRPDLGGIDLLALADFEESSKVRVDDHSSRMGNWASCNRLTLQPWMSCVTRLLRPIPTRFIAKNGVASTPRGDVFWPAYSGLLLGCLRITANSSLSQTFALISPASDSTVLSRHTCQYLIPQTPT